MAEQNKEQNQGQNQQHQGQHQQKAQHEQHPNKTWYDKNYRKMLVIPAIALILAVVYLSIFVSRTGDIINKDVSLTGGTTASVFDSKINIDDVGTKLLKQFPDIQIRKISDISTGGQRGFSVETKSNSSDLKSSIEGILGYKLTQDNSSFEFSGATLSSGFYNQLIGAIEAAFLLMSWVVFLIFADSRKVKSIATMLSFLAASMVLPSVSAIRIIAAIGIAVGFVMGLASKNSSKREKQAFWICAAASLVFFILPIKLLLIPIALILIFLWATYSIPSLAVVLCAFADITMTVAVVDLTGMNLSLAGIIAFLMLIGYSVDTDILLTTRVLKRGAERSINEEILGAFKTGLTMTLTAIASVGVSFIIIFSFSETLKQIFLILLIGLGFDIFNTWITNASMVKWYVERKGGHAKQ